jgi:hypothetical protein
MLLNNLVSKRLSKWLKETAFHSTLAIIKAVKWTLVAHTGFEPAISSLRGRCPGPLDECATNTFSLMAGEEGFEPSHTDSESAVLPLDDSPVPHRLYHQLFFRAIITK